jgi:hypothetical protein
MSIPRPGLGERGRTIATYIIISFILVFIVPLTAYAFKSLLQLYSQSMSYIYTAANMSVNSAALDLGSGVTVTLPMPRNPALRAMMNSLLPVLVLVGAALVAELAIAVLLALTVISYALSER